MARAARASGNGSDGVDAYIAALEHPLRSEVIALREILLRIDPAIGEEVKWNAPSFRTSGHFATLQLREPDCVRLILHLGARKRDAGNLAIEDPDGLLQWLGPDRACLRFRNMQELQERRDALERLVRQWLRHV